MKTKAIVLLLAAAVAVSAAVLLLRSGAAEGRVARITRDGALLEEIDLDKADKPYSFTLEDESGRNTVSVERGRICVSEADCPDQVCVSRGWISDSAVPIICLPHKLVIEIVGGEGAFDGGAG